MKVDALWEGRPEKGRPARRFPGMFEVHPSDIHEHEGQLLAFVYVPRTNGRKIGAYVGAYEWRVLRYDDVGPYILLHNKKELKVATTQYQPRNYDA